MTNSTFPVSYPPEMTGAPPPCSPFFLNALNAEGVALDVSTLERAEHARDWWPLSIPEVARGYVTHWPGVVVRAKTTRDVSATLRLADQYRVAVTAQGGRSNVVGGAVPSEGAVALDLTELKSVIELDCVSSTVRVGAGTFGPDLENFLEPRGFTVGHFPQSFELATVGGWIANRGAGQFSNRYGKVEDIVRALTVVLAGGKVLTLGGRAPRESVGPDLMQLFVGSEGTLGVITEATLLVRKRAASEERATFIFHSFAAGLDACRRILQRDAHPAVLRLYDEAESKRNFDLDGCALLVLDEGEPVFVRATMEIVRDECRPASPLDSSFVGHWLEHRNEVGTLGALWTRGFVVDTIEVAAPWATLNSLRERVSDALSSREEMNHVSVHQSHAYLDGACLYFTFVGQPRGDAAAFYRGAWDAAMNEVLRSGAAISHHHGIGRNRARFVPDALGPSFFVLEGVKEILDPHHIMNPGVMGLGGDPW